MVGGVLGMNHYSRAIAVLTHKAAIGRALDQLVLSGFPLSKIFLLGQDSRPESQNQPQRLNSIPIREFLHQAQLKEATGSAKTLTRGILMGNLVGGVLGVVVGLGLMAMPALGKNSSGVLSTLLSALGVGVVAGSAIGGLIGQEINDQRTKNYAVQVDQGNFLLIINGSEAEIFHAEHILYVRGAKLQNSD